MRMIMVSDDDEGQLNEREEKAVDNEDDYGQ